MENTICGEIQIGFKTQKSSWKVHVGHFYAALPLA